MRCGDNSLYTGITTDLERRFSEHSNSPKGAKYTHSKKVVKIESAWETSSRSLASKLEYKIKKLKKQDKEQLVNSSCPFSLLLGEEFDKNYTKIKV